MAPKKRNNSVINAKSMKRNDKKAKNGNEDNDNNEDMDVSTNGSNGLRRSQRQNSSKSGNASKSKYFDNDSEDDIQIIDSRSDEEFEPKTKSKKSVVKTVKEKRVLEEMDSSSDNEDWEEVKDNPVSDLDDYNPVIPSEGVDITLNESEVKNKKKKKSLSLNDYIRQRINRFKRELQTNKHKTSLLLLISRTFYLNNSLSDGLVKGIALSITANNGLKAPKKLSTKYLNQFIDWFQMNFQLIKSKTQTNESISQSIVRCLQQRSAQNSDEMNLTFISLIRSVDENYNIRVCYALNAVNIQAKDLILSERQIEIQRKSSVDSKSMDKQNDENKTKKSKSKRRKTDSETEESIDSNKDLLQLWVECYIESESKWICLDLCHKIVDKPLEIASKSFTPISYVIGLDSNGFIREITQRYLNDWMSVSMKRRRIDQNWWTQTLEPFMRRTKSAAEKAEDSEFETKISATPLPTKVGEYKNHPLYVLKKDLLKFQGIYPSDAPPLGFFRGEPVYARECVQLLRSRETWVRFARTVRIGETAYKMVKSRPKWDKYVKDWKRDMPLELFGEWQTEAYVPPEAKDGKVPRNGYGNVDLFQPCMLPKGCVHLQLPGLLRIANKLNIDCSPAIVAFDNNGTIGCHPVMDGFIVCEEFKEILIAAWDEEQENINKREIEKREKRVYENWRKLIKGLLIREKLKKKYANSGEDNEETDVESDN